MDAEKLIIIAAVALFIIVGFTVMVTLLFGGVSLGGGEKIAVIDLKGEISDSDGLFSTTVRPDEMKALFEEAAADDSIKAVVLKINSGGGGVVESKEIARALSELSDEKPVVSWIGSVGASGAYYVAAFSDHIVADSDSMVGSIGVIGVFSSYKDLFEEKLGINTTVIKSGKFKDMGSPYRYMTEEEEQKMQDLVDEVHKSFLTTIVLKRGLNTEQTEAVGEASIMLGSRAVELGLVDQLGGLEDAIDAARQLASAPGAVPYELGEDGFLNELMGLSYGMGRGIGDSVAAMGDIDAGASFELSS